jgi:hypothetical protein
MSNDIVVRQTQLALAVQSMADLERLAERVSKTPFAPKDMVGRPDSCFVAMLHGSEIGLSPMQALQSIAVINGRPSVYGDAVMAICRSHPDCDEITESIEGEGDNMRAVCVAVRKGKSHTKSFSVAQAKKAQLWGKSGPWSQYPERMLQMRARSWCLRDLFADALKGIECAEEMQDVEATPVVSSAVPARTIADVSARVSIAPQITHVDPEPHAPVETAPECDPETGEIKEPTLGEKIRAAANELGYKNASLSNFCANLIGKPKCENDDDRLILLEFLEGQIAMKNEPEPIEPTREELV